MTLLPNWREVAARAWSMQLLAISILLSAADAALPFFQGVLPIRPGVFAGLVLLINIAAAVARLLSQRNLKD